MANKKEIQTKIGSVKNTQKITKAMEMVAASKMRRTQETMKKALPYADKIRGVIGHIFKANPDYKHPFLVKREVKSAGYIVVSSDKGLCGGLNVNMFRPFIAHLKQQQDNNIKTNLCLVGAKGVQFFRSVDVNVIAATTNLGEEPLVEDLVGAIKIMLDEYTEGKIDQLFIVHNNFVNTMSQKPEIKTLLPIDPSDKDDLQEHWDYIYEPDSRDLLDYILMRYIESQVYRAVVENVACEMAAKMVAMKSATDNAGELIDELELDYNKARQAAITQEISEIVGGAAAV
ncbi:MAG TPA: F0F1 ATP synthase subunit gamma [Candidatus Thioglobus sp.]|jgi:F-type H+-transporting ATPase subunit gamma|nr:F0F1 ATP synthase subunit gamma [Candidatus Thioglobus sp.]